MEKEYLLPYSSPRTRPPPLDVLPEDDEFCLSSSCPKSELKNYLIFGQSSASPGEPSSPLVDALTLHVNSNCPSSPLPSTSRLVSGRSYFSRDVNSRQESTWLLEPSAANWTRKSNLHRSRTAPAMAGINDCSKRVHVAEKPQLSSDSIVRQAIVLLALYLTFGGLIYWYNRHNFVCRETHPVIDAIYFCIVTMCTIGYGDITPNSTATKLFSILFVLVGFGFIDILLTGMVSHVLDMQENHLLRNVKRGSMEKESSGGFSLIDVKKGRMRIRMKVAFALGVVILCIGFGVVFVHLVEGLEWLDSFYLSVMSVTTVGYGDKAFTSMSGRLFASVWLLISTIAVARAFLFLTEARVDKRNRKMAKWVLGQNLTVSQFLAADIDNNGFVSKSEYVIYKLKEMKKVPEKEILQICQQFDKLDTGNCGKITLADLMNGS